MMRTVIRLFVCFLFAFGVNAESLEDFANNLSPLSTQEAQGPDMSTDVAASPLTEFAYNVGFDVSKLSDEQRSVIAADYGDKPSWSFCDEHMAIEITMSGNNLWERTKLMQLQRKSGASLTH